MTRPNIIITGFMGTGKTTVGKRLAAALGYDFVDTDELIVARTGQTIEEIFKEKGEAAFREMEAAIARELSEKEGTVIATGGGTMLDRDNAAALPYQTFVDSKSLADDKMLDRLQPTNNPVREVSTVR